MDCEACEIESVKICIPQAGHTHAVLTDSYDCSVITVTVQTDVS